MSSFVFKGGNKKMRSNDVKMRKIKNNRMFLRKRKIKTIMSYENLSKLLNNEEFTNYVDKFKIEWCKFINDLDGKIYASDFKVTLVFDISVYKNILEFIGEF